MTITFSWEIPHWTIVPLLNGLPNVVSEVKWRLFATDGVRKAFRTSSIKLPIPTSPIGFIKKEQITEALLIEWIKPLMGYDAYEKQMTDQITAEEDALTRPVHEIPNFAPAAVSVANGFSIVGGGSTDNLGTSGTSGPGGEGNAGGNYGNHV